MRILQVHSPYRIAAGEDTVVANEARLLRTNGHEVWQFFEANPTGPVPTLAATAAAPWNALSARQLRNRLRVERPDVVHLHNTWFRLSPSVLRVLRDADVPVVRTLHNYRTFCIEGMGYREGRACIDCLDASPWLGVRHTCYRGSAPLSAVATLTQVVARRTHGDDAIDLFLAPSEFMRSIVVRGGIPAERTVVKTHFTLDPGARPSPPSESDLVVVVGRVSRGKGVDLLLEAWRALPAHHGMRLEVIGSGPQRPDLAARAPHDVSFTSLEHPQVMQRLLGARALVFPSLLNETFGMVLSEAMAAGLPVVAFDVAATGEVLGRDAWPGLLPAGDVAGLTEHLQRLGDGAMVDAAGARNRAAWEDRLGPTAQLPLLEAAYALTIERHAQR